MNLPTISPRRSRLAAGLAGLAFAAWGCAHLAPESVQPAPETAYAVTQSHRLVSFNAGTPQRLLSDKPLTGLPRGERLVDIDFRVARGQLFGLSDRGRLFRIDPSTGVATVVGGGLGTELRGNRIGIDFNPTVDRLRVIGDTGMNLRVHPDTGQAIDAAPDRPGLQEDAVLAYEDADAAKGRTPRVSAPAYTYNKRDEKLTTNYAIDLGAGTLVRQGSREGVQPVVSPNTGRLATVGPLGLGALDHASMDIADVTNTAYAAVRHRPEGRALWVRIDLERGQATPIGPIAVGEPVIGIAIEP